MIKKILWMTAGFGAGISSSLWVKRLARRRVEQYSGSVSNNFLSNRIETTKTTLKNARAEGKKVVLKYQDRRIQLGFCLYQGKYKLLHPEMS